MNTMNGTIKRLVSDKGFGFILASDFSKSSAKRRAGAGCMPAPATSQLGENDMLGARTLGALTRLESHLLTLTQSIELRAGGLVEEVFAAVLRRDEPEALVADETLDRAGDGCHLSNS